VFEVDRPETLATKRHLLDLMLGVLPHHVTLVGSDFSQLRLSNTMAAAGFQATLRTFFIWEGVTQYLTAEAIEDVLGFVANAAIGSLIAFTYINQAVVDGTRGRKTDRKVVVWTERMGEPWQTGFDPGQIGDYLAARRLAIVAQVGAPEYRARYLEPVGRSLNVYDEERVVVAEVVTRALS
jgi:methyltransferase (TIGR00027 family)